jgi:hypothetical protein
MPGSARNTSTPPVHTERLSWRVQRSWDKNFGWFLVSGSRPSSLHGIRILYHLCGARFQMDEATAGLMCLRCSNPLLGWLGDHLGHRILLGLGALCTGLQRYWHYLRRFGWFTWFLSC